MLKSSLKRLDPISQQYQFWMWGPLWGWQHWWEKSWDASFWLTYKLWRCQQR